MTTIVRSARQLVTMRGHDGPRRGLAMRSLGIIPGGCVLVREGRIVAAGTPGSVERLPGAREAHELDATGKIVMPGFVDSHTHLAFGASRIRDYEMRLAGAGYAEIAAAGGGILASVRTLRELPFAKLERQARGRLRAMERHGTTTVEAKSGYGLDEEAELKTLRVLRRLEGVIPTYLGAHATPPEFTPDAYIEWMCETMLPRVAQRNLARFADVYCDEGAFTVEQARKYLRRAAGLGLGLRVHAEQFARTGAARLAVELGAASADHLEQAGEEDVAALAKSPTIATLLPGSAFHLGLERYAPARALIDAGAAVALATDFNPGTSPVFSMQAAITLACSEMHMTPEEALAAATINGAHALGVAGETGSLEADKRADIIMLRVADYREIPRNFGTNTVEWTMKNGEVVA